jgi:hypothetical protein
MLFWSKSMVKPLSNVAGHCARTSLAVVLLGFSAPAWAAWWQVVVESSPTGLILHDAQVIPGMIKSPRTPGLVGAPALAEYRVDWLDGKKSTLKSTTAQLPLGIRAPKAETGEGACFNLSIPGQLVALRIEGPDEKTDPKYLRFSSPSLKSSRIVGLASSSLVSAEMELVRASPAPVPNAGPVGVTKVRNTGADSNRLVMVVLGDGYTAANLSAGTYNTHVNTLLNAFLTTSPWDAYFAVTNVYRISVESNESGADQDRNSGDPSVFRDTYLNSTFWTSGIERLLSINSTGRSRAISAANSLVGVGVWDSIFVLVNSTRYGGSGGSISVSSVHPAAPEVIIHEFGHTFAGLADEYTDAFPGFPAGDSEPNVDFDSSGPGLKWLPWVNSGTPLPTPDNSSFNNVVGAFQGARYLTSGIYRPWRNCKMRSLGVAFCPVCKEAHVQSVNSVIGLADAVLPFNFGTVTIAPGGTDFTLTPVPISSLTYQWSNNGSPIPGQTASTIRITPNMVAAGNSTLTATVTDSTPLVRLAPIARTTTWNIVNNNPAASVPNWKDY